MQKATSAQPQMNFITSVQGVTQITEFLAIYEAWQEDPSTALDDMSKNDAIWLMEAAINYKNAFQLSYWENEITEETNYTGILAPGNSEFFTGSSILSNFALMDAAINTQISNNNHNMILVVDLYLDQANSNSIIVKTTGARSLPTSNISELRVIENDDYWIPAVGGKCGPYAGQFPNMDAAERTEDIINWNWWNAYYRTTYNPQDVLYYTDVVTVWVSTSGNGSNPNGCWGVQPNVCQNPTQMQAIHNINENATFFVVPSGKQLIRTDIQGSILTGGGNGDALHEAYVKIGIPHVQ